MSKNGHANNLDADMADFFDKVMTKALQDTKQRFPGSKMPKGPLDRYFSSDIPAVNPLVVKLFKKMFGNREGRAIARAEGDIFDHQLHVDTVNKKEEYDHWLEDRRRERRAKTEVSDDQVAHWVRNQKVNTAADAAIHLAQMFAAKIGDANLSELPPFVEEQLIKTLSKIFQMHLKMEHEYEDD